MADRAPLVDVHSHIYLPWYLELLRERTSVPRVASHDGGDRFVIFAGEEAEDPPGRALGRDHWDPDEKLTFMNTAGIEQSILSLGNPWLDPFPGSSSLGLARRVNADFASFRASSDGRLVGMGVLPASTVEDVCTVVAEVAADPHLVGIVSGMRICGRLLDDPELEPVWEALSATGLPLLLHPSDAVGGQDLDGYGHALPIALGFPFETTVGVTRLVLAGVLTRHLGLRVVASHGGGTLPFLAHRLDAVWRSSPDARVRLDSEPPSAALARVYVDTIVYGDGPLGAMRDLVPDAQAMYGTDHPFSVADPQINRDVLARAPGTTVLTADGGVANARLVFGLPLPEKAVAG